MLQSKFHVLVTWSAVVELVVLLSSEQLEDIAYQESVDKRRWSCGLFTQNSVSFACHRWVRKSCVSCCALSVEKLRWALLFQSFPSISCLWFCNHSETATWIIFLIPGKDARYGKIESATSFCFPLEFQSTLWIRLCFFKWFNLDDALLSKSVVCCIVLFCSKTESEIATWLILPVAYACLKD